jgi:DHA1 family tetracycline resistance protein-like MFS transporter
MSARKPAIIFILITALIDSISFGIIIPVFPDLIMSMENCDLSHAAVIGGWMMFGFAISQFLFSPVLGNLSDKYGRRPVLLASLFGFGLDYILLSIAPTVGWLFLGRVIAGIMGASYTTATAYISDISTNESKAKNYGMLGAAFGLGFILGNPIGGFLAELGVRAPFIACAVLSLLNWVYGYFVLPESLKPENRRPFSWKRANPIGAFYQMNKYRSIIGLLVCFFLLYLAATAVMSNWQYYAMYKFEWNARQVSFSLMVVGIMVAVVQGFLVRVLNPRIGNTNAVIVGLVLYTLGMLSFGLAPTGFYMLLAIVPYCLGGINGPAMQAIMSSSVPKNSQGELQGIITSVQSLTAIIGPPMMAGIFSYYTSGKTVIFPGAAFIAGSMLLFTALVIAYFTLEHNLKGKKDEQIIEEVEEQNA